MNISIYRWDVFCHLGTVCHRRQRTRPLVGSKESNSSQDAVAGGRAGLFERPVRYEPLDNPARRERRFANERSVTRFTTVFEIADSKMRQFEVNIGTLGPRQGNLQAPEPRPDTNNRRRGER